jgi:Caspase domain
MPRADHYAVLLAINYYPAIGDLNGPENDIEAFRDWLLDPQGGDVDPVNIRVVRSSDHPKVVDPLDAKPNEIAFRKALNACVRDANQWRERVGQRLYLYMAGHGFTSGATIGDPAVWSAGAGDGDSSHIAGYRYATRIVNADFFDEVVLIMDCCQDVLKTRPVLDPTWDPPDRRAHEVKLFAAYGAPRGQAAYERDDGTGRKRGIFSKVLLEALKTVRPDADGFVTGQAVKDQFLNIWGPSYQADAGYTPPIVPPHAQDIRLFRRAPTPVIAAGHEPVSFVLQPPVPAGAELQILHGSDRSVIASMPATSLTAQPLLPGFYKAVLTGTARAQLFEVHGTSALQVTL